jgi:hypothetical protein
LVVGVLAFLVSVCFGGRPATSYADSPPPPTVGLSGPSQATMPDGVLLHLTMSSSPDGDVSAVIYDENWNVVGGCVGSCDIRVMTGLLEGGGHQVQKTFHAQSHAPDSQVSVIADKAVSFDPPDWQVSLDLPAEVSMPAPIPVTFGSTPSLWSPRTVNVMNADTDQWAYLSCATNAGLCSGNIATGWIGGVPVTRHYRAQLKEGDTTLAAATKAVTIYPPNIGVTVTVSPFVLPGQTYKVKVTNIYNQWTPYTILVRDGGGTLIGMCAVDQSTCEFTRSAGAEGTSQSFTATVTYGTDIVSQTSPATVDFTDPATADSNEGIDIGDLAGLFGSTAAVCDSLLFFPGTHVQNTSTSDQENACVLASQASGATVEDVIRAALAAMAAAGIAANGQSLLAWLQHYIWEHGGTTWSPGPPPPPGHPTNPSTPTPVPVASAVDALAASLTARNAAVAALGAVAATEIARRCLNLTGDDSISGDPCKTRPIFLPGSDYPTATNHRIAAIASWPAWARLHRRFGPRTDWYQSQPECQNVPAGSQCDEFPENRTYEGGNPGTTKHRPSLSRTVSETDNGGLGRKFGLFLGKRMPSPTGCKIPDGGEFLVVPLPPALGIPTQTSVCNFPIP